MGVVQRLRAVLPESKIGRYGADELLVVTNDEHEAQLVSDLRQVEAEVATPDFARVHGAESPIALCAGVATWDQKASPEVLLCYADAALYAARLAKGGVELFNLQIDGRAG
jgi:GGDEF domain-containing protein